MAYMQRREVRLPPFVVDHELATALRQQFPDYRDALQVRVVFDWSAVRFFDDYTLLKLILLQRRLRLRGSRISNSGFKLAPLHPHTQTTVRQLWMVGLPELTASGHLIQGEQLSDALTDEWELLETNPFRGLSSPTAATAVVPLLCSHDRIHFAAGSREEKHLDAFVRTCLRPPGSKPLVWDLVESREFRHLMLQQLRRNVQEHSRSQGGESVGLALLRVWTPRSLFEEWGLASEDETELLRVWGSAPAASVLQGVGTNGGILHISIVDDGEGIPARLRDVHEELLQKGAQQVLLGVGGRLRYTDAELDTRFSDPASWTDERARLIAFATDWLGTSKPNRAPEIKGLHYLRQHAVINMGGSIWVESDGAALRDITSQAPYGKPCQPEFAWPETGGTGVCLAVPVSPIEYSMRETRRVPPSTHLARSDYAESRSRRLRVSDLLAAARTDDVSAAKAGSGLVACASALLDAIMLGEAETDVPVLRRGGLLLIDWGEVPDSKTVFHGLLSQIAEVLAGADPLRIRAFVFVNLPKGLCCLLGNAIGKFASKGDNPTPICAFTTEQTYPFWLGIEGENVIPEKVRAKIRCETRRRITDHRENRTEAIHREAMDQLLAAPDAISVSDLPVLSAARYGSGAGDDGTHALDRLGVLVRRCALFREEQSRSPDGEMAYTGRFQPVFRLDEIANEVCSLFLDKFRNAFTQPPVCFTPADKRHGIKLPHSTRVVDRYFRSDALVDHSIAAELTQELVSIALSMARQTPRGRIDWVVTCTSPLHWFVHKIVDGLADHGVSSSHHVFQSYEEIPALESSHEELPDLDRGPAMRRGEAVLAFTDVMASGQTAYRMADSLIHRFGVQMAGLIALADIRTADDRAHGPDLDGIYGGRVVCLYHEPVAHREDLEPRYYVHPETVVPKRAARGDPMDEFFESNYSGTGPLVEQHAVFGSAKPTLDLMRSLGAVRFGHFQHGNHHSEIFVDVEKVFSCSDYRNLMVTALFRYIVANGIRLVLYPSHSSAYMLADDLKQRFAGPETMVEFIMACRTFSGTRGTSYALTRFSPYAKSEWTRFSNSAVLILDDAVCSGATVESIMAELARIDGDYYDGERSHAAASGPSTPVAATAGEQLPYSAEPGGPRFSVHVVAFLNRLPRVSGDFWRGLWRVAAGRVQFSTFIRMPLAADSAELCPQCRLGKRLDHERRSGRYCLYAKEFLSWWIGDSAPVSSHERRHKPDQRAGRFTSAEALRLAGYLSAIERHAYHQVSRNLLDSGVHRAEGESDDVRLHVRARAAFIHGLMPGTEPHENAVPATCSELRALIDITMDPDHTILLRDGLPDRALDLLQLLTIRYLRTPPRDGETEATMECLFQGFGPFLGNRLLLGGVACVLDSCLAKYRVPWGDDAKALRGRLRETLRSTAEGGAASVRATWALDWLGAYLDDDGASVSSLGKAVQILASYAQRGRKHHIYGRSDLDRLFGDIQQPTADAPGCGAEEVVRRVLASCDQFAEMLIATRALRSRSDISDQELTALQQRTARYIEQMRQLCTDFEANTSGLEAATKSYEAIRRLFVDTYLLWFPTEGKTMAGRIIGRFLPLLADAAEAASNTFDQQRLLQVGCQIDYEALQSHKGLKVMADPEIIRVAVSQVLDNFTRLAARGSGAQLNWDIGDADSTDRGATRVDLIARNTGTPVPDVPNLRLRGLSAVQSRLQEYGGDLAILDPAEPWTFGIAIRLRRWAEV